MSAAAIPGYKLDLHFGPDDDGSGRRCGTCQLCCKLLPVVTLQKKAGQRCQHQKFGKGCSIYYRRPEDCRVWSCRWLVDDETAGLPRPDRAHYVIDVLPDFVRATDNQTGEVMQLPVVQVWVDPAYPEAHREPALRAYLAMVGERERMAAVVRWDSRKAVTLIPPALTANGHWIEIHSEITPDVGLYSSLPKPRRPPL